MDKMFFLLIYLTLTTLKLIGAFLVFVFTNLSKKHSKYLKYCFYKSAFIGRSPFIILSSSFYLSIE